MRHLNINRIGYVVGLLLVAFYLVCTAWGVLLSAPALKELHFQLLQLTFPGFAFTIVGYSIGLVEAFVYGWAFGALFAWLHRKICCDDRVE